jgi:predicted DCC family thiol-disulfide oxidoreductase YuxK
MEVPQQRVLTESSAAIHILSRLDGLWAGFARLLSLLPKSLRDAGYHLVGNSRYRLFARPDALCPLVPSS